MPCEQSTETLARKLGIAKPYISFSFFLSVSFSFSVSLFFPSLFSCRVSGSSSFSLSLFAFLSLSFLFLFLYLFVFLFLCLLPFLFLSLFLSISLALFFPFPFHFSIAQFHTKIGVTHHASTETLLNHLCSRAKTSEYIYIYAYYASAT